MNPNLKIESFKEKANSFSYDTISIIERALFRFYEAYTQMYIPTTMAMTLRECTLMTLNEYFKVVQDIIKRGQASEKVEADLIYTHYNKICLHVTKCCIGKGGIESKFLPELEAEFLKATGIVMVVEPQLTENEHNNPSGNSERA